MPASNRARKRPPVKVEPQNVPPQNVLCYKRYQFTNSATVGRSTLPVTGKTAIFSLWTLSSLQSHIIWLTYMDYGVYNTYMPYILPNRTWTQYHTINIGQRHTRIQRKMPKETRTCRANKPTREYRMIFRGPGFLAVVWFFQSLYCLADFMHLFLTPLAIKIEVSTSHKQFTLFRVSLLPSISKSHRRKPGRPFIHRTFIHVKDKRRHSYRSWNTCSGLVR